MVDAYICTHFTLRTFFHFFSPFSLKIFTQEILMAKVSNNKIEVADPEGFP